MPIPTDTSSHTVLNLLAATLELEFGSAESLCYGLADATGHLPQMQKRFLEQLRVRVLAAAPDAAEVLLSGSSLGGIFRELSAGGRRCVWLNQGSPPGVAHDQAVEFLQLSAADSFDCIVIEGTINYLDQLGYLQNARSLLRKDGSLILAGEFLDDDSRMEKSDLANLSSARQLAERLGLYLTEELDLTAGALLSLEKLQALATKYQSRLATIPGMAAEPLQILNSVQDEFASGRRTWRLLEFRKGDVAAGEYANAEFGDINSFAPEEIAGLFEKSFQKPFDPALWQWKYARNNGQCVIARQHKDGPIVAHYGGAPRRIDYFGSAAVAIQVCDVMVQPEERRHYGKSSLFFKTAATFLEREIGNTVKHLLGFGFPNQKAMNIATRLGLYEKTDDFVEVLYNQDPGDQAGLSAAGFDAADAEHARCLEQLWQAMRAQFHDGIIGVRDLEYFRYRYVDHPGSAAYRMQLLSDGDSGPLAVAVLKRHEEHDLLMDVIASPTDFERVVSGLTHAACADAEVAGLKFWVTKGWLQTLPTASAIVNDLGIEIPCNSWNPGPSAEVLYGAWWLTAGDMDFM